MADRLAVPFVELDALFWQPHWTPEDAIVFRSKVDGATAAERWVIAGNYSQVRDLTCGRADTVVWLDLWFPLILWRLTRRTVRRVVTRHELWNGNRETFRAAFMSRHSLYIWLFRTHWKKRHRYERVIPEEYSHLTMIRITRRREVPALLASL